MTPPLITFHVKYSSELTDLLLIIEWRWVWFKGLDGKHPTKSAILHIIETPNPIIGQYCWLLNYSFKIFPSLKHAYLYVTSLSSKHFILTQQFQHIIHRVLAFLSILAVYKAVVRLSRLCTTCEISRHFLPFSLPKQLSHRAVSPFFFWYQCDWRK